MLFLLFRIGGDSFALGSDGIVEVVPLCDVKPMRKAPSAVTGSFNYRGCFVPVVDLCVLELGSQARRRLSTRIIVARHPADEALRVGLIAENVTEVLRLEPTEFAPFAAGPSGLVQRVEVQDLLPAAVLAFLSGEAVSSI